ncbi:MAG: HAD family hydrolase [Verrucomicrobiales bacterium]
MPVALYCFDFDGTLVDKENSPAFEPALARQLTEARREGASWVINTGRSLHHTLEGVRGYGIPVTPDFIIAREHEIYARNRDGRWADLGVWNGEARRLHDTFFRHHARVLSDIRRFVEDERLGSWIEEAGDPAGLITHSEAGMARVIEFVHDHIAHWPDLGYQRNTIYLRFTHRQFDKGTALRELGRHLGLTPGELFAAGDNFNDLPMLRRDLAHHLVAPANSLPEVKSQVVAEGGQLSMLPASRAMAEAVTRLREGR